MALEEYGGASSSSKEHILKENGLWEGWGSFYETIPLGPGKALQLGPRPEAPDPEVVGFACPLPPVDFAIRNERKFPPPSDSEMFMEMYALLHCGLRDPKYSRSSVLASIYDRVNCNRRDSPGWQRAFLQAEGLGLILELWRSPDVDVARWPPGEAGAGAGLEGGGATAEEGEEGPSVHYWVVALLGRMLGTCEVSRMRLIEEGAVEVVLEAARSPKDEVRECAVCSLKGLIQYEEGRAKVTYNTLIECLGYKGR